MTCCSKIEMFTFENIRGRLQKHSLTFVYRNQCLNWFPYHHPDRLPATLNCYLATHGHTLNTL